MVWFMKHWWMMDTSVEKIEMLIWKRLESHFHIWEWWNRCRYLRFIKIIYWYRWIRIGCRWSWHIPIRSETNVHFVLNHLLIRYEMECLCIEEYYTPNLETSKSIKIGDPTVNDYHVSSIWMMKESYHYQMISDYCGYIQTRCVMIWWIQWNLWGINEFLIL